MNLFRSAIGIIIFISAFGSHECLGRYVGMVMIPEMVRQVLIRQDIKAKAAIDYKVGPFPEQYYLSWTSTIRHAWPSDAAHHAY